MRPNWRAEPMLRWVLTEYLRPSRPLRESSWEWCSEWMQSEKCPHGRETRGRAMRVKTPFFEQAFRRLRRTERRLFNGTYVCSRHTYTYCTYVHTISRMPCLPPSQRSLHEPAGYHLQTGKNQMKTLLGLPRFPLPRPDGRPSSSC